MAFLHSERKRAHRKFQKAKYYQNSDLKKMIFPKKTKQKTTVLFPLFQKFYTNA